MQPNLWFGSADRFFQGGRRKTSLAKAAVVIRSCARRFAQDDGFLHLDDDGEMVNKRTDLYWTGLCRTFSFLERPR
jgi:hypothetical protein